MRSQLQSAALQYMVFQLSSKEDVAILESTFQTIDKDGNGSISKEELIEGYRNLYLGMMC